MNRIWLNKSCHLCSFEYFRIAIYISKSKQIVVWQKLLIPLKIFIYSHIWIFQAVLVLEARWGYWDRQTNKQTKKYNQKTRLKSQTTKSTIRVYLTFKNYGIPKTPFIRFMRIVLWFVKSVAKALILSTYAEYVHPVHELASCSMLHRSRFLASTAM